MSLDTFRQGELIVIVERESVGVDALWPVPALHQFQVVSACSVDMA